MIIGIFVFIYGLIIGSFINAFVYRYKTNKGLGGRSFCPACKHKLAWFDLIPVISWLLLNRKCRYCKAQISFQYPLVEFSMGLLALTAGLQSGLLNNLTSFVIGQPINFLSVIEFFILTSIFFILLVISIYDIKKKEIPNSFNLTFILASLSYLVFIIIFHDLPPVFGIWYLVSGLIAFLFFYSFVLLSKETWMGGGDAKFAFGMGILLGPANTFVGVLLATWIGAAYGLFLMKKKKGNLKTEIPFGPFLVLGTVISFLFGSQLVAWYAKIFLGY